MGPGAEVNILDQLQKLKVGAAAATLVLSALTILAAGVHFGGALIGAALFSALGVGALMGAALMRFIE